MKTLKRSAVSVSVAATVLALAAGPVHAAETGGAGAGESEKIQLPDRPRDQVGLILIGLGGLAGLAGLENARRQLKGSRKQATGEWRWR